MYAKINNELEKNYKITDYPLNLAIEVTNNCNLNCIMCNHGIMKRPKGVMHTSLYRKIIDETAIENPNCRIWLDFYGEALLTGFRVYYFIDYAKKKGLTNICINTNGTVMKDEYVDMLLDSGVDYISLDCDGFSKEVYEKIRVNGNRDTFFKNVEYLLSEKKRRNSKTIVDIKVIEMEENAHEVDKIVDYWSQRGAWVAVRRKGDWTGLGKTSENTFSDRIACGHAIGVSGISWDGEFAACGWDYEVSGRFGNVRDKSIKELWKKKTETFLKAHIEHDWDSLPDFCINCSNWKLIGEKRVDDSGKNVERAYGESESIYKK